MTRYLNPALRHWPLLALLASAAMLATAHAFEKIGGLMPCLLCLRQREVYWAALAVAAVALIVRRTPLRLRLAPWFDIALGLVFLFGAGVAFYHAGVEWHWWPGPSACAAGGSAGGASVEGLKGILDGEPVKAPSCDKPLWIFLGLSMAGWNVLVSLILSALSFLAAAKAPRS